MKRLYSAWLIPLLAAALLASIAGCGLILELDQYSLATCDDGIKDGDESDVDCGGLRCDRCALSQRCSTSADCSSGQCTEALCVEPTCVDTIKNGAETDVDCGGSCGPCGDGALCAGPSDCRSGVCSGDVCQASTCVDAVKNGAETGVDCGGAACERCGNQQPCEGPTDCVSGACAASACSPWVSRYGSAETEGAFGVALDALGNIAVTGSFRGSLTFGCAALGGAASASAFVVKLSPEGSCLWSRAFKGAANTVGAAVAFSSSGDIIVAGVGSEVDMGGGPLPSSGGSFDIFVGKLSGLDGGHLWSRSIRGAAVTANTVGDLSLNSEGDVHIGGSFTSPSLMFDGAEIGSAGGREGFVAKLSGDSGERIWSVGLRGTGNEIVRALRANPAGDVVVAGSFSSPGMDVGGATIMKSSQGSDSDIFLLKLSGSTGARVWSQVYGGSGADDVGGLAIEPSGHVVMSGSVEGGANLGGGLRGGAGIDAFVASYQAGSGTHRWSKAFGGALVDRGGRVAADPTGGVLVIGSFQSSQINAGGRDLENPSSPLEQVFLVKLVAEDGAHLFSTAPIATGKAYADAVAVSAATSNVVVAGTFEGEMSWGGAFVASAGQSDIVLASLGPVP